MNPWDKTMVRLRDGQREQLEPDNRAVIALACFVLCAAIVFAAWVTQ